MRAESVLQSGAVLDKRIIANSLIESFLNPLKGVFMGCERITAQPDMTPR
jgi:hypothetical protein